MALDLNLAWMLFPMAGIVVLVFTIKSFRIRLRDSPHLVVTTISAFAFLICMLMMAYYLFIQGDLPLAMLSQKFGTLALLMTFIAGYFYYEGFISSTPPTVRLTIMAGSFILLVGVNLINIFDQFKDPNAHTLVFTLTFAYGIVFHLFAIRVLGRVKRLWNKPVVKIDLVSLVLVGFYSVMATMAGILELLDIVTYMSMEQILILSLGSGSFVLGIGALIFNNMKFGQYIYHIPFPIHHVLIYGPGGLLVYGRKVSAQDDRNVLKKDEILVSGALSAFSTFFKESLGMGAVISHINATEYEFYFVELPKESGTIILLTSGSNKMLQTSLERFRRSFSEDILAKIKELCHDGEIMSVIDDLVMKAFPYLVVDKTYSPFNF